MCVNVLYIGLALGQFNDIAEADDNVNNGQIQKQELNVVYEGVILESYCIKQQNICHTF